MVIDSQISSLRKYNWLRVPAPENSTAWRVIEPCFLWAAPSQQLSRAGKQSQCPSWETEDASKGHLAQGLLLLIILLLFSFRSLLWNLQRRNSHSLTVNDILGQNLGENSLWNPLKSTELEFRVLILILSYMLCFVGERYSQGDRRWYKSFLALGVCHKQVFHITSLWCRDLHWFVSTISFCHS